MTFTTGGTYFSSFLQRYNVGTGSVCLQPYATENLWKFQFVFFSHAVNHIMRPQLICELLPSFSSKALLEYIYIFFLRSDAYEGKFNVSWNKFPMKNQSQWKHQTHFCIISYRRVNVVKVHPWYLHDYLSHYSHLVSFQTAYFIPFGFKHPFGFYFFSTIW